MSKLESRELVIELRPDQKESQPGWKWKGTLAIIYFTALINGYDVSNVANIQSHLYGAFGHIELLPWISLSYSLALFSVMFLMRHLTYHFDLRRLYLLNSGIFLVGAAVASSAQTMAAVILGRIVMGIGGAFVQQINMFYVSVCAPKTEATKTPARISTMSASWAVGLLIGGPIGSAFSEHLTWRWAFLVNLPCVGAALAMAYLCVPEARVLPDAKPSLRQWPAIFLNIMVPVLLALALTFSGSVWRWDSQPALCIWAALGVALLGLSLYFFLKFGRSRCGDAIEVKLGDVAMWIGSACAGSAYAISLYYFPLYFAFAKGADALQQAVWVLPFVFAFIGSVAITGRLLPFFGVYRVIFAAGGALVVASGSVLAAVLKQNTPTNHVMCLEIFLGVGVGLLFQHSIGISNAIKRPEAELTRLDRIFMCNFSQMGGIAITLEVAGCIFQNVGYRLVAQTVGGTLSEEEIRGLLAGNAAKSENQALMLQGAAVVSEVIAREFYVVAAAGGVCFMAGILFTLRIRHEKVDFSRTAEETVEEGESSG